MQQQQSSRVVIRAARLIDGTGAAPLNDPVLVLQAGRVEAICCGELPAHLAEGARWLDLPGKTLLPGLIDAHVHLVFDAGPNHAAVCQRLAEADDGYLLLRAQRNAQALLSAGVTTARDCGDRNWVTLTLRRAIEEGLVCGPRLLCCGPPITTTAGHLHFCGNEVDSETEVRRAVRLAARRGADFIKVVVTGGMMTAGSNPRRSQFQLAELKAAVSEAHRLGKRVAAHVLATEGIAMALEAGVDTLEHCNWLGTEADSIDFQPALARDMARSGVWWSHTCAGVYRELLPNAAAPEAEQEAQGQALRAVMERFRRTLDAGARMVLSSDAGVQGTPFERFVDGLEVAVRGMEVSPLAAIEACTRVPAEALGLGEEVGTLTPGHRADVLVVDGDPSRDVGALRRVVMVLRDGEIVFRGESENGHA
ncbi:MAG: amidohydrolase family protein [Armatimonadota bacterium]|nr:amidohydrolase family protein [Armatimonadota bacterium]